jgi:GTP cyclohydrolase II
MNPHIIEKRVGVRARVLIPLEPGGTKATFISFGNLGCKEEHFAIKLGPDRKVPLVRLHSECITGDLFGSMRCDCGNQLKEALQRISEHGGYLLYLRQEGRGIGLYAKIDAYVLQSQGRDTFEANRELGFADDQRSYEPAARMLHSLGVKSLKLLTNNPDKVRELAEHGLDIAETVRTGVYSNSHNFNYLRAKARARHTIDVTS